MIVVDTNILAGHCLPGPGNKASELLLQLDPEWAAPVLWRSEFRNVLCGYLRRGVMNLDKAGEVIAVLEEAVAPSKRVDVEAMIAKTRALRESLKFTTTPEEIDRFKREGRE